ncbi:MAG: hypothetical protein OHK005_14360 [Candidatus Methylacidiphilales bacterium]
MKLFLARVSPGAIDPELVWGSTLGFCGVLGFTWLRLGLPLPGCLFKAATGLPCLTCGGTRAARALFAGDFAAAFLVNPLVALALILTGFYVPYALTAVLLRTRRLRFRLTSPGEVSRLRWLLFTAALLNWVYVAVF